jgi:hypothetical protein
MHSVFSTYGIITVDNIKDIASSAYMVLALIYVKKI